MIKGYCYMRDSFSKLFSGEALFPLLSLCIIFMAVSLLMAQLDTDSRFLKAEIVGLGEVAGLTS